MNRTRPQNLIGRFIEGLRGNGAGLSTALDPESTEIIERFLTGSDPAYDHGNGSGSDTRLLEAEQTLQRGLDHLRSICEPEGYWNARLDSNAAIDAETIAFHRYMGIEDPDRDRALAHHILEMQRDDGSWGIYHGGPGNLSTSILAYFGLKLAGIPIDDPRVVLARRFILENGGILRSKFECKFVLALFGQYPWSGLPPLPTWLLLVPDNAPFSIYEISYWTRICLVPMAVLREKRVTRPLPPEFEVEELYLEEPEKRRYNVVADAPRLSLENAFQAMGRTLPLFELSTLGSINRMGQRRAQEWILAHQDDSGDWGGIYPAILYSLMALTELGLPADAPEIERGIEALYRFQTQAGPDSIVQQACLSPVWDTAWALLVLRECGIDSSDPNASIATRWLLEQQIDRPGDWAVRARDLEPGGWCFQFNNDFYPDIDDSAVVLMSLQTMMDDFTEEEREAYRRGTRWVLGLQNDDGGWAAFEKGVDRKIIDHLPINDINNMLDPSTSDVTGRVLEMLGSIGFTPTHPAVRAGIAFLRREQEPSGAWFGRWGVNYIYGTWSVLTGLARVGFDMGAPMVRNAVAWLNSCQNEDGGWGESCRSYEDPEWIGRGTSTPSQTAWALMALVAAGDADCAEAHRGAEYLARQQNADGSWEEEEFTGTGFPGAFYLRYHYYCIYFPLLALGRFRNALLRSE